MRDTAIDKIIQDSVQDAMDTMGLWQIIITVAAFLVNFPIAWNQHAIAVIAPKQDFTCVAPEPMYLSDSMLRACFVVINEDLPEVECTKFSYDNSTSRSTIISEWDLVCERKHLLSLVQPLTQVGVLFGSLGFGLLADKIGRKASVTIAVGLQTVTGMITPFMPTFELFLIFKSISAIATGGTMLISFIIVMEIIGVEFRSTLLTLYHVTFVLGSLTVPLLSYLTRTWNDYLLVISILASGLIYYYWVIPESPRWLLAVGEVERARQVLHKAAKMNKICRDKVIKAIEHYEAISQSRILEADGNQSHGVTDLIRTPNIRLKTLCIAFNWLNSGMVFFGVDYYFGHMSNNVLSDLAILAAFRLPGLLIVFFLISRVPRVKILITTNILSGLCLMLIIAFHYNATIKLILMTIALTSTTISFPTIHLYTGELFPTVIRSSGFAICSVAFNLGNIIAPFLIGYLDDLVNWLIPVILGLGSMLGVILYCWLPETMNCKLPETINDAQNFKRNERTYLINNPIYPELSYEVGEIDELT